MPSFVSDPNSDIYFFFPPKWAAMHFILNTIVVVFFEGLKITTHSSKETNVNSNIVHLRGGV